MNCEVRYFIWILFFTYSIVSSGGTAVTFPEVCFETTPVRKDGASDADVLEFRKQLTEFLDAVVHHDADGFNRHLNRDLFSFSILPKQKISTFEGYQAFQHKWNTEMLAARWSYVIEDIFLYGPSQASAVILADYRYVDSEGVPFQMILRITDRFIRRGNIWYLQENQNTLLSETKPFSQ